jgi:group I intron endonuclease
MVVEVYCVTSPSGKRYVGQTARGFAQRWAEHKMAARSGNPAPLYRALRKYGAEKFSTALLERMSTEAGAKRAERLWVRELGTFGPRGYNSTAGGEGTLGHRHTPETRAKITAAQIGRPSGMLGKKASAETRAKQAAANTGNAPTRGRTGVPASPESRAKASASWTPEMRAAMSARMRERQLGHSPDQETREKMRLAKLGRTLSEETRAKMSASQKAAWAARKNS